MRVIGRLTGSINFLRAVLTLSGPNFSLNIKKFMHLARLTSIFQVDGANRHQYGHLR